MPSQNLLLGRWDGPFGRLSPWLIPIETPFVQPELPGTFHFLTLPAELRNAIYRLVLDQFDYKTVPRYFHNWIEYLLLLGPRKDTTPEEAYRMPPVTLGTPAILLVCKSIYREASGILRSTPLEIAHSLYSLHLSDVMPERTLRNLTHIVLSDVGHDVIRDRSPHAFKGFRRIADGLADMLHRPGHAVNKVEIILHDITTASHIRNCWANPGRCDIHKWTMGIYNSLKCIRGIRDVKIEGWLPGHLREDLLRLMPSKANPILALPYHLRKKIYTLAADLNHISNWIDLCHNHPTFRIPARPTKTTPTMLLVDRVTSAEAVCAMKHNPLVIRCTEAPRFGYERLSHYFNLTMVRRIHHLRLVVKHRYWLTEFVPLFHYMGETHRLHSFHLDFVDCCQEAEKRLVGQYPTFRIVRDLEPLYRLRRISRVRITGSLPDCFALPLAKTMTKGRHDVPEPLFVELEGGGLREVRDLNLVKYTI